MKTLTASKMCMLYCALIIICSFVSTARTANMSSTTAATNNISTTVFNSDENLTEYNDYVMTHPPKTAKTSTTILKYSSTTTPGTPSVTDSNELQYGDESATEDFSNLPSQPKSDNGKNLSGEKYNYSERIPTNDVTQSKPMERVTFVPVTMKNRKKWSSKTKKTRWGYPSLSHISYTLLSHKSHRQTMEKESKEQPNQSLKYIRAIDICIHPDIRKYLNRCKNKEKATRKTRIQEQYENKQQAMKKTPADIELEKIEKWKRDQGMLDMDSERFESVLNILHQNN